MARPNKPGSNKHQLVNAREICGRDIVRHNFGADVPVTIGFTTDPKSVWVFDADTRRPISNSLAYEVQADEASDAYVWIVAKPGLRALVFKFDINRHSNHVFACGTNGQPSNWGKLKTEYEQQELVYTANVSERVAIAVLTAIRERKIDRPWSKPEIAYNGVHFARTLTEQTAHQRKAKIEQLSKDMQRMGHAAFSALYPGLFGVNMIYAFAVFRAARAYVATS